MVGVAFVAGLPHGASATARRRTARCDSTHQGSGEVQLPAVERPVPSAGLVADVVNGMLSFPPVFEVAKKNAKEKMVARGSQIGVDWAKEVERLRQNDLEAKKKSLENPDLHYPDYYLQPFHAYSSGNLNWDAGLEAISASITVHSTVMSGIDNPRRDGDEIFRNNYVSFVKDCLQQGGVEPREIIDIGCSVGISTVMLKDAFPAASVVGVDPSVYMLAVASAHWNDTNGYGIEWRHEFGENLSSTPDCSVDMVAVSLVWHELPRSATGAILKEVSRVLRPGGHLAVMEMDPTSEQLQKLINNPLFRGIFKATEPWLDDYITLDFETALADAGFSDLRVARNSTRHRSIVCSYRSAE